MGRDATFEEGGEAPLRLLVGSAEDLGVVSALVQDSVGKVGNIQYAPRRRRFSLLLYRFRWEDRERAAKANRAFERVASALTVDDVLRVRASGVDPRAREMVLNILNLVFEPSEDGAGLLRVDCSGDATIQLQVECLNLRLADLTRPWAAGGEPQHF